MKTMVVFPLVKQTLHRLFLVKMYFLHTDHNGNNLYFIGQLFTTTEEDTHAVNEDFLLEGTTIQG